MGKLRALMDERPGIREPLRAYALGLVSAVAPVPATWFAFWMWLAVRIAS